MLHSNVLKIDSTIPTVASTVELPENPFNLYIEIRKHPAVGYGEDAYFIPKGTPEKLFPGKKSAKTLVQACKTKLQSKALLEVLRRGDPGQATVVRLSRSNVVLRTAGRGRPIAVAAAPKEVIGSAPARVIETDAEQEYLRDRAAHFAGYRQLMTLILDEYADIFESHYKPVGKPISLRSYRRDIDDGDARATPNVCQPEVR